MSTKHGLDKEAAFVYTRSADDEALARQGKKAQLKRNFGFLSMLGFTTTMLVSWEAIYFLNANPLQQAGPVGLLYGFIVAGLGSLVTALSIAELVSMAPTSGGQYHWVAVLAPPGWKIFLSWITGWLSLIGWQAIVASAAYLSATIVQGMALLNYPDYMAQPWHATLIIYAVLLLCVFVNTAAAPAFPHIEALILIIHILGFFAVIIPITYMAPKSNAQFVFTSISNLSGWENPGVAWLIGMTTMVFPFLGYDGPCHMVEEVKNAPQTVPWIMIASIGINGVLAFGIVLVLLYTIGDIPSALSSRTGYDFIQVFFNVTKSYAGATALTAILAALCLCATFGVMASASRITWAFARDHGLPFSPMLAKVHRKSAIPLNAVLFTTSISVLLALINIGSSTAFLAFVSITIAGLHLSYFVPIALLAYRRCVGKSLELGPFSMGRFGVYVNIASLIFLLVSTIFSFFPPFLPVTPANMNWSCLVFGVAVLLGLLYYAVAGKKVYKGPVIEIETEGRLAWEE